MKNKIYLAGAMSNADWNEQNAWRILIQKSLENFECINPCDYFNLHIKRHNTELEAMNFDLRFLKRCNLVIANLDIPSTGTAMEIATAYDNNIPIIGLCTDLEQMVYLHPWIKCCMDRIFNDVEELIEYVSSFYEVF